MTRDTDWQEGLESDYKSIQVAPEWSSIQETFKHVQNKYLCLHWALQKSEVRHEDNNHEKKKESKSVRITLLRGSLWKNKQTNKNNLLQ